MSKGIKKSDSDSLRMVIPQRLYETFNKVDKNLTGRLLTLIESLGGSEEVIKARKDMVHILLNEHYSKQSRTITGYSNSLNKWLTTFVEEYELGGKSVQVYDDEEEYKIEGDIELWYDGITFSDINYL